MCIYNYTQDTIAEMFSNDVDAYWPLTCLTKKQVAKSGVQNRSFDYA